MRHRYDKLKHAMFVSDNPLTSLSTYLKHSLLARRLTYLTFHLHYDGIDLETGNSIKITSFFPHTLHDDTSKRGVEHVPSFFSRYSLSITT